MAIEADAAIGVPGEGVDGGRSRDVLHTSIDVCVVLYAWAMVCSSAYGACAVLCCDDARSESVLAVAPPSSVAAESGGET